MLRGEIRLTDLIRPGQQANSVARRSSSVTTGHASAARLGRGVVTIVPVTSNVARVYPFQVLLNAEETGLRVDSKARANRSARYPWSAWAGRRPGPSPSDGPARRCPPHPPPALGTDAAPAASRVFEATAQPAL